MPDNAIRALENALASYDHVICANSAYGLNEIIKNDQVVSNDIESLLAKALIQHKAARSSVSYLLTQIPEKLKKQNLSEDVFEKISSVLLEDSDDIEVRRYCCKFIAEISENNKFLPNIVFEALSHSLEDKDDDLRKCAAYALSNSLTIERQANAKSLLPNVLIPALEKALTDRVEFVRTFAACALGSIRQGGYEAPRIAVDYLMESLEGEDCSRNEIAALRNVLSQSEYRISDKSFTTLNTIITNDYENVKVRQDVAYLIAYGIRNSKEAASSIVLDNLENALIYQDHEITKCILSALGYHL